MELQRYKDRLQGIVPPSRPRSKFLSRRDSHLAGMEEIFASRPASKLPSARKRAGRSIAAIAATPAEIRQTNRERLDRDFIAAQQVKLVPQGPLRSWTQEQVERFYETDIGAIVRNNNGGRVHPYTRESRGGK